MNSLGSVRGSVRGFTLIELLVAISIAAILASIAAPSFTSAVANQRLRSAAYELGQTLQSARSKAILSRRTVDVRASYPTTGNNWNGTKTGTLYSTDATADDVVKLKGSSFYIFETGSGTNNTTVDAGTGAISNSASQVATVGPKVVINAQPVLLRFSADSTVASSLTTVDAPTNAVADITFAVTSPGTTNTGYTVTLNRFGLTKVTKNS
jgi:type IV fimbrial biogenesis protein FimT